MTLKLTPVARIRFGSDEAPQPPDPHQPRQPIHHFGDILGGDAVAFRLQFPEDPKIDRPLLKSARRLLKKNADKAKARRLERQLGFMPAPAAMETEPTRWRDFEKGYRLTQRMLGAVARNASDKLNVTIDKMAKLFPDLENATEVLLGIREPSNVIQAKRVAQYRRLNDRVRKYFHNGLGTIRMTQLLQGYHDEKTAKRKK